MTATPPVHEDESRTFPLGAVLSYTTGCLLADLSEVYAVGEYLAGRPMMTHHHGVGDLADTIEATIKAQHPDLPISQPPDVNDEATCLAFVAGIAAARGSDVVRLHPLADPPGGESADRFVLDSLAANRTARRQPA